MTSFRRTSLAIVAAVAFACSQPLGPLQSWSGGPALDLDQAVNTNGTIRFVAIEGGCWAIRTPQGDYEPANLPQNFRINGLAVHATLRGTQAGSFCMIAPVVSLDSIRVL